MGVVLTPAHITEFFADISEVNKTSVVFDNCTGTCGFLIAAMSRMIKDANGDIAIEKSIKKNQLIGIEKMIKCIAWLHQIWQYMETERQTYIRKVG